MSGETYVGAIDQGTTGTRFMVFDHDGKVVANAYEKHEQIYPEPGWVEHDANEIWDNTKQVIDAALSARCRCRTVRSAWHARLTWARVGQSRYRRNATGLARPPNHRPRRGLQKRPKPKGSGGRPGWM